LEQLLARDGDMPVSAAIQKLREPPVRRPVGAPTKTLDSLHEVYGEVEKRRGGGTTQAAMRAYAKELGQNPRSLERQYYRWRRIVDATFDAFDDEQLRDLERRLGLPPLEDKDIPA
jgi:hypothetical protein